MWSSDVYKKNIYIFCCIQMFSITGTVFPILYGQFDVSGVFLQIVEVSMEIARLLSHELYIK